MDLSITFLRDSDPREIRSLIFPELVRDYLSNGVQVMCEAGIASGYGISDTEFERAGAIVLDTPMTRENTSLISKYKPPTPEDVSRMPVGCSFASYLHLEDNPPLAAAFCKRRIRAFAFEFIEDPEQQFPVTRAHSEIAGKMAVLYGRIIFKHIWGEMECFFRRFLMRHRQMFSSSVMEIQVPLPL